jgi:hypothetical protein
LLTFATHLNPLNIVEAMIQTISEKLQLKDEKNLLIQGLPSSIEKQFTKLSFSKNVTPLLRSRKIDFALVFAVNQNQLGNILHEVLPALHDEGKLWIAYPKTASKIVSDLNRACSWSCLTSHGYVGVKEIVLDHVWTATRFQKPTTAKLPVREILEDEAEEVAEISPLGTISAGRVSVEKNTAPFRKVSSRKERAI